MIESIPISNCWQMPNIHSPSGSVDSGMGCSPQPYTYTTDEYCNQIFGSGVNPESPNTCSGGSLSGIVDSRFGISQPDGFPTYAPVLTERELEELSEISDEVWSPSPCSVGNVSSVADIEEISSIGFQQDDVESILNLEPCREEKTFTPVRISTVRRKERLKIRQRDLRQSHPGVDSCLIPKSGNGKPRQSRKKRKAVSVESMAGAQVNHKKYYIGARVKITARERLQKLREEENASAVQSSTSSNPQAIPPSNVTSERKRSTNGGSFRPVQAPMHVSAKVHRQQYIPHSVERILQPAMSLAYPARQQDINFQAGLCDVLDQGIEDIVVRDDPRLIQQYIEQAKSSCNMAAQTLSHEIIDKLNMKKGVISPQHMEQITEHICKLNLNGVNQKNFRGETPIYRAALYANAGAVKALMKYGANPYIEESSAGETALHAAVKSKNLEVVTVIIKWGSGYDGINKKTFDGNTALHRATGLRNVNIDIQSKMVVSLLNAGADPSLKNNMNEMSHSFLPEELKELQMEMRRINGRRRSVSVPIQSNIPAPPQVEPHILSPTISPQYPTVTQAMLQQMMRPMPLTQQFQHRVQHAGGFTPVVSTATPQMSGYAPPPPYSATNNITPQDMDDVLSLWE